MYKAVIFDFFDVFRTDAYKAWLRINDIPHEGAYAEASYLHDMGTITTEEFLERLSKLQGKKITRVTLDSEAKVDDDVVQLAISLKKHYKTALISNGPSALIRELLQVHDLERLFDEIVISSEVSIVKPDHAIFELALRRLGVRASESIFIDDNPKYVAAAEGAGITAVQFVSARQLKRDLEAAGLNF